MYFLGFDVSTQQLKVIATDTELKIFKTYNVEFDDLDYNTDKGVVSDSDGSVLSVVDSWLDAIDHIFTEMQEDNFPFDEIVGISGSCQQHGSVFWNDTSKLNTLSSSNSLVENLKGSFYKYAPNWQDHSTGQEQSDFENFGVDKLTEITGSTAHYRFTGLQIRKFSKSSKLKQVYNNTERISLVSSFISSILLGKIAQLEESDACGMNLYDIQKKDYNNDLLALAANAENENEEKKKIAIKDLRSKLGEITPVSHENIGKISNYFVEKYNFNPDCKIYSFTGDNLATIISLPLKPNDYLISLGTSTTVLLVTKNYVPSPLYHLFKHPTLPDHYMGMICYCNGALAREKIRDDINKKYKVDDPKSWDKFDEILDKSSEFSNKLGIYFPLGEIVPNAKAQTKRAILKDDKLTNVESNDNDDWSIEDDVSAIIDSQTLSCRLRSGPMLSDDTKDASDELKSIYDKTVEVFGRISTDGHEQDYESLSKRPNKCYYVGGGSNNESIIKKMGSILAPVNGNFKVEIPNACALGGAFKASWSYTCEEDEVILYDDYLQQKFEKDELEKFEVEDQWLNYFTGCGMLSKLESQLEK